MPEYTFTLFIAGGSELGDRAVANFDRFVRARLEGKCSLTIVDILKDTRSARAHRVIATPMLVRDQPLPVIKILGDLSQESKLLNQLGLNDSPVAQG